MPQERTRRDASAYLDAVDETSPATTTAVADAVGVTRQGADYRLRSLEEDGLVEGTLIGNTLVWSLPDDDSAPTE